MIGSRPINLACLSVLALLVFCASASARDVYVAELRRRHGLGPRLSEQPPRLDRPRRRRTGRRRDHPRRALRLGRRPGRGLGLGDRHQDAAASPPGRSWSAKRRGGIAITPNGGRAYVTNSGDDTVTVLNTATFGPVGEPIPVGKEPDGVAISPDGGSAFVAQRGGGIAVIDTNTAQVVETIDDSFGPSRITMTPDGRRGFVTNHGSDTVTAFSPGARTVLGSADPGRDRTDRDRDATPNGSFAYAASAVDGIADPDRHLDRPADRGAARIPRGDGGRVHPGRPPGLRHRRRRLRPSRSSTPTATPRLGRSPSATNRSPSPSSRTRGRPPSFWVSPTSRRAKKRLTFHASNSTDPDGKITQTTPGTSATAAKPRGRSRPAPTATAGAGTYFVTLKVTDNEGCSTETVFTGQTASCTGNPLASVTVPIKVLNPTGPKLQVSGRERQGMRQGRRPRPLPAGRLLAAGRGNRRHLGRRRRAQGPPPAPARRRTRPRPRAAAGAGWSCGSPARPGPGPNRRSSLGGTAKARVAVNARDRENEVTVETKVVKLGF